VDENPPTLSFKILVACIGTQRGRTHASECDEFR
jgi:hypothetical protein